MKKPIIFRDYIPIVFRKYRRNSKVPVKLKESKIEILKTKFTSDKFRPFYKPISKL